MTSPPSLPSLPPPASYPSDSNSVSNSIPRPVSPDNLIAPPCSRGNPIPNGVRTVVLAGGKGTRLLPYTTVFPKPLMPIGDRPILEIVLTQLREAGLVDVVISVGHLAELIMAFFQNGEKWGLHIDYAIEDKPLGTIGPLPFIEGLGDPFFVLNGDILTDLDLRAMFHAHQQSNALITVATYRREVNIDFGTILYNPQNLLIHAFEEKPTISYDVSTGVYLLSRRCLEFIPRGQYFGFDNLILKLLEKGMKAQAFPHRGRWLDIGRPSDYERAIQEYTEANQ